MVKQKHKLWGKIEVIKQCKTTIFDTTKYQLKLVGVDTLLWVNEKDLSEGVAKMYQTDGSLEKNAKARVNRVHVKKHNAFLADQVHTFIATWI